MPKFDKSTGYKMAGPSWYGGDSGSPAKQKTATKTSGHQWVDNPTKDHTMDKYEGTMYMKDGKYKGGLKKTTDQVTGKKTYTKYKPTKNYKRTKEGSGNVKTKNISKLGYKLGKFWNRVKGYKKAKEE